MWKPPIVNTGNWLLGAAPFLLLAAAIRLWNFGQMPLMNDELSALSRLDFSTLSQLIAGGVAPDAHPALVQVFLWIWVGAFGTEAWVVRLPFLLMALAAIAILYRLAYAAFGKNTANLAGAMLAASQLVVVFSLQARPYASGMLICSALAWVWYKIVFVQNRSIQLHFWFALLIALSVYNHYFSGLLGVFIWFSGLVFYPNISLKNYIGAAVVSFVLFLPHLSVSLVQLQYKGIGSWLRPPKEDFLYEWFLSSVNYSSAAVGLILMLLAYSVYKQSHKLNRRATATALVFLVWFFLVFALGYAYSKVVDPLLHHGALFFATPFFIIGLAYFITPAKLGGKIAPWVMAALLLIALVRERKHYEVMHLQPYSTTWSQLKNLEGKNKTTLAVVNQTPGYLDFYGNTDTLEFPVINIAEDPKSNATLMKSIVDADAAIFYTDGRNGALVSGAMEIYPAAERLNGFTHSGYTFRKKGSFDVERKEINRSTASVVSASEFIDIFKVKLDTFEISFADELSGMIRFANAPVDDVHLVFSFEKSDAKVSWSGPTYSANGFEYQGDYLLPHQVLLWDAFITPREMNGVELKIYIWNPNLKPLEIKGWEVHKLKGNPNLYGQFLRRPK